MDRPTEVFYDGRCAWCRLAARVARRSARPGSVVFCDFTARPSPELPLPACDLGASLTTRADDGAVERGFEAVLAVADRIKGLRWLVPLGRSAPVNAVGSALYKLVARIRPTSKSFNSR